MSFRNGSDNMTKKIIIIFSIFVLLLSTLTASAYAIDDIISQGKDFIADGESQENPIEDNELKPLSDTIYNILLIIAIVLAVIMSGVLGIGFMVGSIEEQAKIKESLIPFVVGCIIVFGGFGIWKVIAGLVQNI